MAGEETRGVKGKLEGLPCGKGSPPLHPRDGDTGLRLWVPVIEAGLVGRNPNLMALVTHQEKNHPIKLFWMKAHTPPHKPTGA